MAVPVNASPLRDEVVSILHEILTKHTKFSKTELAKFAENMERGIFNATITISKKGGIRPRWDNAAFDELYNRIALRVVTNIDPTSYVGNKTLINRLAAREFLPHEVAFMAYPELAPETWREPQERINKKMEKMCEISKEGITNKFTCARCKRTECRYYELQTRSADEPMTKFITCTFCQKRWKENN